MSTNALPRSRMLAGCPRRRVVSGRRGPPRGIDPTHPAPPAVTLNQERRLAPDLKGIANVHSHQADRSRGALAMVVMTPNGRRGPSPPNTFRFTGATKPSSAQRDLGPGATTGKSPSPSSRSCERKFSSAVTARVHREQPRSVDEVRASLPSGSLTSARSSTSTPFNSAGKFTCPARPAAP